jgi:hypothetical protein
MTVPSEADATILIAVVVHDVARQYLDLAHALEVHEVFASQVTSTGIEDELTRFKVCCLNSALDHMLIDEVVGRKHCSASEGQAVP